MRLFLRWLRCDSWVSHPRFQLLEKSTTTIKCITQKWLHRVVATLENVIVFLSSRTCTKVLQKLPSHILSVIIHMLCFSNIIYRICSPNFISASKIVTPKKRHSALRGKSPQGSNWTCNTEQAFLQAFPTVHNKPHLDTSRHFSRGMFCIPKVRQEKFLCEHKWHAKSLLLVMALATTEWN